MTPWTSAPPCLSRPCRERDSSQEASDWARHSGTLTEQSLPIRCIHGTMAPIQACSRAQGWDPTSLHPQSQVHTASTATAPFIKASFQILRVKLKAEEHTLEHVAVGVGAHGRNTCKPRTWEVEAGDLVIAYIMSLRSKWVPGDPVSKTGLYVGAPLFSCFVFSPMWLHVKLAGAAVHCTCFLQWGTQLGP